MNYACCWGRLIEKENRMSLQTVKDFLLKNAPDVHVDEVNESTATVALAAQAHGVEPGQIGKTLSLRLPDQVIVIVMSGDTRLDNKKFKDLFGVKAKMLGADEVEKETSHPIGGVCPFGLPDNVKIYCDLALKKYTQIIPAGGAINACVKIETNRMAEITRAKWIDVAQ